MLKILNWVLNCVMLFNSKIYSTLSFLCYLRILSHCNIISINYCSCRKLLPAEMLNAADVSQENEKIRISLGS